MRRNRIHLVWGWLVLPALLCGCDEKEELAPSERLFRVGASASSVCPATDPQRPGVPAHGDIEILGTVFGRDGSTAAGVPITFSTSFGCFDPEGRCVPEIVVPTGETGVAKIKLGLTRPPNDKVLVQAATDNNLDGSLQILVPRPPQIKVDAFPTNPNVNETFKVFVDGSLMCDVFRLDLDLSYDPAVVDYDDSVDTSHLDTTPDGTDVSTQLDLIDQPGRLSAAYYRTNVPLTGVSYAGTFLTFRFKALAPGNAKLKVESFAFTPVDGPPYPSLPDQIFLTTVTVKTPSTLGGGTGR